MKVYVRFLIFSSIGGNLSIENYTQSIEMLPNSLSVTFY